MQKTLSAMAGLAILALLLVGPSFLAVSAATAPRCGASDLGCERPAAPADAR